MTINDIYTIFNVTSISLLIISAITLLMVLKRDLMMLQQNSYRNERYVRWFHSSHESTSTLRIASCIALFVMFVHSFPYVSQAIVAAAAQIWIVVTLLNRKYKKPLVFTARAKRIYATMVGMVAALALASYLISDDIVATICVIMASTLVSPLFLLGANIALRPIEKAINRRYYNDAARILSSMPDLKIIGITGSYGKTSTKHYLHRILSEKYDTLMTPGSFNTTLGVIRTIREHLKPYNQVFIVEMGAKQPGDIKEICDLVNPQIGIITAVGPQHLESFKTIENIQRTKFELIDALPSDGFAVINNDFEFAANRNVENVAASRYAVRNTSNVECIISDIVIDHTGTGFTLTYKNQKLRFHTKLVGECNISNLAAAIIVALHLDVDTKKIAYAVEKIEQVEHRLNLKRTPGGITIIDDAFNSNPTGSAMALDVLANFDKSGRRIIVTPGMIELGDRQYELNCEFGRTFAGKCDIAIIVGQYNREAIVDGAIAGGMNAEGIITVASFNEAQQHLSTILAPGDTILYENDLPDTFK